jgi:hypothetical protein
MLTMKIISHKVSKPLAGKILDVGLLIFTILLSSAAFTPLFSSEAVDNQGVDPDGVCLATQSLAMSGLPDDPINVMINWTAENNGSCDDGHCSWTFDATFLNFPNPNTSIYKHGSITGTPVAGGVTFLNQNVFIDCGAVEGKMTVKFVVKTSASSTKKLGGAGITFTCGKCPPAQG